MVGRCTLFTEQRSVSCRIFSVKWEEDSFFHSVCSTEVVIWCPFLISNFRRVLNVLCFLLGNSPASEFYMPTFRNTLFHLHTYPLMKMEQTECSESWPKKFRPRGITQKKAFNVVYIVKKVLNARFAAEFTYILVVTSLPNCNNYILSIGREIFISQHLIYCRGYCRVGGR